MSLHPLPFALGATLACVGLLSACGGPTVKVYESPDGTIVVESMETTATVTAIDARARTITLKRGRFHQPKTFKVGEEAVNFEQIQVGDEVHAVVVEELAVALVPGGTAPMLGEAQAVALAPEGSKPAIVVADTVAMTAVITAIDGHAHQVTLELPDGTSRSVKVGKHVDLTRVSLGDSIVVTLTEAVALAVVKPR